MVGTRSRLIRVPIGFCHSYAFASTHCELQSVFPMLFVKASARESPAAAFVFPSLYCCDVLCCILSSKSTHDNAHLQVLLLLCLGSSLRRRIQRGSNPRTAVQGVMVECAVVAFHEGASRLRLEIGPSSSPNAVEVGLAERSSSVESCHFLQEMIVQLLLLDNR